MKDRKSQIRKVLPIPSRMKKTHHKENTPQPIMIELLVSNDEVKILKADINYKGATIRLEVHFSS